VKESEDQRLRLKANNKELKIHIKRIEAALGQLDELSRF
jgi:hypothetical protein